MNHLIDKVPLRFNEGPFWGNASMGALLYTDGNDLRFSVDQVGLWETRDHTNGSMPVTFTQACSMDQPEFSRQFTGGSFAWQEGPCPTRLPGLTFRIKRAAPVTAFRSETNLTQATTALSWRHGDQPPCDARIWLHGEIDVLVIESVSFDMEQIDVEADGWDLESPALAPLASWGYRAAERRRYTHGEHLLQRFSGDRIAVLSVWRSKSLLVCTLSTGAESEMNSICSESEERLHAVAKALPSFRESHLAAWRVFWDAFEIHIPDGPLQRAVEIELYKLFCNARSEGLPMTLQGIWNHDQAMPAWHGDWHNDLNVQACYWAAFKTNHSDLVRPYIDYYAAATPHFRQRADQFADVADGLSVPTCMAPGGAGSGAEWTFWNSLLGPELYSAIDFCWYYEYTRDEAMLRNTIVAYLSGVARFYEGVTERREDGRLHVPFSHSPEIFDADGLVLTDDTTFMVSSLRYVLERLAEYQSLLGATEESEHWRMMAADLVEPTESETGLQLWPGRDLCESHRHFTHLFPIYPLSQMSRAAPEQDAVIQASLDRLSDCGSVEYACFSFPYRAILCARGGRGHAARLQLYNYLLGLRAPNTFCVNGDAFHTGVIMSSDSSAGQPADVFTLEAGLIVPAAVCEMLAHRAGSTLWLLPAIPPDWREGRAKGLTIEGGHSIDLEFSRYTLARAVVHPGSDEKLTVVIGAAAKRYRVCAADSTETTGGGPFVVTIRTNTGPVEIQRVDE